MEDNRPPIESRIAELEAFVDKFQRRQKERKSRYAFDSHVKAMDQQFWKMNCTKFNDLEKKMERENKKTTALAVTSTVAGLAGMVLAAITFLRGKYQ